MLLSYGWRWKKEEPCNIYILLFIYFASAGTTSGIPASFLYRNQKEGKERGRGKDRDNNACVYVCAHVEGVG